MCTTNKNNPTDVGDTLSKSPNLSENIILSYSFTMTCLKILKYRVAIRSLHILYKRTVRRHLSNSPANLSVLKHYFLRIS